MGDFQWILSKRKPIAIPNQDNNGIAILKIMSIFFSFIEDTLIASWE